MTGSPAICSDAAWMTPLSTSRSQPRPSASSSACKPSRVDVAAEQVRYLPPERPWRVVLEPAGEAVEQQRRRARTLDLGVDRPAARAGNDRRRSATPARRRPPARSRARRCRSSSRSAALSSNTRDCRRPENRTTSTSARAASLKGAHPVAREAAVGSTQQRRRRTEQRAVEIHVEAAHGGATVAPPAPGRAPAILGSAWRPPTKPSLGRPCSNDGPPEERLVHDDIYEGALRLARCRSRASSGRAVRIGARATRDRAAVLAPEPRRC